MKHTRVIFQNMRDDEKVLKHADRKKSHLGSSGLERHRSDDAGRRGQDRCLRNSQGGDNDKVQTQPSLLSSLKGPFRDLSDMGQSSNKNASTCKIGDFYHSVQKK